MLSVLNKITLNLFKNLKLLKLNLSVFKNVSFFWGGGNNKHNFLLRLHLNGKHSYRNVKK